MSYLEETFDRGGHLARASSRYEPRPSQVRLAGAIDAAMATGAHLVA